VTQMDAAVTYLKVQCWISP